MPWDRVLRYGFWDIDMSENITWGRFGTEDAMYSLLVDDGVPARGHRVNIFNPLFNKVGIHTCTHAAYGYMVVMVYAGEFYLSEEGFNKI
jgi:uncharacterized protein YkwD